MMRNNCVRAHANLMGEWPAVVPLWSGEEAEQLVRAARADVITRGVVYSMKKVTMSDVGRCVVMCS
jgi:hypothetical protein